MQRKEGGRMRRRGGEELEKRKGRRGKWGEVSGPVEKWRRG